VALPCIVCGKGKAAGAATLAALLLGTALLTTLIRKLFGADAAAPPDAMKLDAMTEAVLARALSALPPGARRWITFAEARNLFSTKDAEYAFGETDDDGRKSIESFAARHRAVINFMPIEGRVYFVRTQD
jgi:hypothetical protein